VKFLVSVSSAPLHGDSEGHDVCLVCHRYRGCPGLHMTDRVVHLYHTLADKLAWRF
jgi:hypothetical protein